MKSLVEILLIPCAIVALAVSIIFVFVFIHGSYYHDWIPLTKFEKFIWGVLDRLPFVKSENRSDIAPDDYTDEKDKELSSDSSHKV